MRDSPLTAPLRKNQPYGAKLPRSLSFLPRNIMNSVISFLAFLLQLSVCQALVCRSSFKRIHGVCLHISTESRTWCKAQEHCTSVGGELVRGNNYLKIQGKSYSGKPSVLWIGLTDFLYERYKQQSGWRWSDGSLYPLSKNLAWRKGEPNYEQEDCASEYKNNVLNQPCNDTLPSICQQRSKVSHSHRFKIFRSVAILDVSNATRYADEGGCSQLITNIESVLWCAVLCNNDYQCVSFYFSKAKQECHLVLYTDAEIKVKDSGSWQKMVLQTF